MRLRIRLVATALLLALSHAATARAADPDPAAIAAAERLQVDTDSARTSDLVLSLMRGPMVRMLSAHGGDQQTAEQAYDMLLVPAIRVHLPELRHAIAILYASKMSAAELDACDAFYRSPTGRKLVATQTAILTEVGPVMTEWGRRIGCQVVEENRQALRQRGVSL